MVYVIVEDVDKSTKQCQALGGKVITPAKEMGDYGRYAVIQDPAGAYMALFTPKE
jgi:predicted enzyme related to lactoylglutathione lyase